MSSLLEEIVNMSPEEAKEFATGNNINIEILQEAFDYTAGQMGNLMIALEKLNEQPYLTIDQLRAIQFSLAYAEEPFVFPNSSMYILVAKLAAMAGFQYPHVLNYLLESMRAKRDAACGDCE